MKKKRANVPSRASSRRYIDFHARGGWRQPAKQERGSRYLRGRAAAVASGGNLRALIIKIPQRARGGPSIRAARIEPTVKRTYTRHRRRRGVALGYFCNYIILLMRLRVTTFRESYNTNGAFECMIDDAPIRAALRVRSHDL